MRQNLIIRASAGTGKTFSLATRFIRLMLLQDVSPDRIVALTFSRAAAQEIYMKLLERLWNAALSEQGACAEKAILLQGLDAAERMRVEAMRIAWTPAHFAEVLGQVIATQHHGTIATLDSFILRIVRSFPLEMGFQHAVDVLDGYGERQALSMAQAALLDSPDVKGAFAQAFKVATGDAFVRTCSKTLGTALNGWRGFLIDHPQCKEWTVASMRRALGVPSVLEKPSGAVLPVTGRRGDPFGQIIAALEAHVGWENVFPGNKGGELMHHLLMHPEATSYAYLTDGGRERKIECSPEVARAVRDIARYRLHAKLGHAVDVVHAKLVLCRMIEREYDRSTRRRGLLTFADFTGCQAEAERDAEVALKLENLQFRFDARFDHWALDEFQDTSQLQWACLKRLVREAAGPNAGRSVMAVGDLKQSIYTWRGGNDGPFKEMMGTWPEFRGECGEVVPNDTSYRYEKHTADFINCVFGPENIRDGGVLSEAFKPAVDRWLSEDCWMTHHPDVKNGVAKAGDYVEVIAVPPPNQTASLETASDDEEASGGAALRVLSPGICACVADLWARHKAAGSTDTIGILVRNNRDGLALAERLRTWGDGRLPVVWEGMDGVTDVPVVRAVLELLKLAEHPEDSFAWKTVSSLFPVCEAVFPDLHRASAVSEAVSSMLTCLGLARTLREIISRILASSFTLDPRSVVRLQALVREGVGYERRKDAGDGVMRFIAFVASSSARELSASPHVIRILTIHRSKGLTLDHVVVPILETGARDAIDRPLKGPLVGDGWAIDGLPEAEAMLVDPIARAWGAAANEHVLESLRLNYVALTRARKSTHVFVCDDAHGGGVQFRDLLVRPFRSQAPHVGVPYGRMVCALGEMPPFGHRQEATSLRAQWAHAVGRNMVLRRTPSSAAAGPARRTRLPLGSFFSPDGMSAAEKGTLAHERYANIAWIDPSVPRDATEARIVGSEWAGVFVRSDAVALWRERGYEIFADGVWETGQFDRVVFRGSGAERTATICDFKTNARRADETPVAFAARMCELYAAQMTTYGRALQALTGIPMERIQARLLLEATMQSVPVPIV